MLGVPHESDAGTGVEGPVTSTRPAASAGVPVPAPRHPVSGQLVVAKISPVGALSIGKTIVATITGNARRSSWQPCIGLIIIARLKTIPRDGCDGRSLLCKQIRVTVVTLCQVQNRLKWIKTRFATVAGRQHRYQGTDRNEYK